MAPTLRFLLHLTEEETTNEVTGKKVTNAALAAGFRPR